ncbi:Clp1/GlmU family protein [Thermococcus waiotapuensis]|uniref:polynucleotide 5'-hydroxyl-kinase n=1 Tax=Thermococcus waiotapuensis TaxID=90909 RepID=A0AAE4NXD6_9EURY|nr:Clp1/GlmU family protein [Thermococcus waiotapuensis]MDV3104445.1 Clp1/GlmU family protein [Thermococcus waiotapuensis]
MEQINKAGYTTEVPEDRLSLVGLLDEIGSGKIIFIGDVDSGKTTTIFYVANSLLSMGYRVAVVDSDVGQKSILPPATVSLGILDGPVAHIGEAVPLAHYFIGTTTPSQYIGETVVGVKRLADIGSKMADFVLIDTTGFVSGPGLELKRMKVELLRPELVVFIGEGEDLRRLESSIGSLARVFHAEKSRLVRPYPHEERKIIRAAKWRAYFSGSRMVEVDLNEFPVSGTAMFAGRPLLQEEIELIGKLHEWIVFNGWKNREGYVVVKAESGRPKSYNWSVIKAIDIEKLSNLLVGFIDGEGLCLGLGIIKWPKLSSGKLEILTPLTEEELARAREIRLGRIRVTEEGEELELLRREEL